MFKKYLIIISFTLTIFGCGDINQQVANDSINQYNLSVKGGDKIEICVHAGLVVAAYNMALDEENYLKWKGIEKRDCRKAGM